MTGWLRDVGRVSKGPAVSLAAALGAAAVLASPAHAQGAGTGAECGALASVQLPATTIELARFVQAGAFIADPVVRLTPAPPAPSPGSPQAANAAAAAGRTAALFKSLPAFCRVVGTVTTSASSSIRIEVWLPAAWNGEYLSNGYSFYGGLMDQTLLAAAVRDGYATATTDAGGGGVRGASFLLNQPEKLLDVGERAWHETTVRAKALARAFYGRAPSGSYFEGCGGEGRQGLAAAQRFPGDFDGIAIGGIANNSSSFAFQNLHVWQVMHRSAGANLNAEALSVLNRAALDACDGRDGAADGIIQSPPACRFDPSVAQCREGQTAACLTPAQVESARQVYAPLVHSSTGARVSGSLMPGSELGWGGGVIGNQPNGYAVDFFRFLVFNDPDWDFRTRPVNLGADVDLAAGVHPSFNPTNPDLAAFVGRGGKLLIYGGWNDVAIPPTANTDYYESVVAAMGRDRAAEGVRLFMVPGMGHCPGTAGANAVDFDALAILKEWRRSSQPPATIVGQRYRNGTAAGEALLCPYPQVAQYRGAGDPARAAYFVCRQP